MYRVLKEHLLYIKFVMTFVFKCIIRVLNKKTAQQINSIIIIILVLTFINIHIFVTLPHAALFNNENIIRFQFYIFIFYLCFY